MSVHQAYGLRPLPAHNLLPLPHRETNRGQSKGLPQGRSHAFHGGFVPSFCLKPLLALPLSPCLGHHLSRFLWVCLSRPQAFLGTFNSLYIQNEMTLASPVLR